MKDVYARTNSRGKKGLVRKTFGKITPNVYPTSPAARRAINTAVNDQHAHIPTSWKPGRCGN